MFPESFARRWIDELSRPGDLVLDPFCGRGTTPFQALLMDREAAATDTNEVALCVTTAKTNAPTLRVLRGRISRLEAEWASSPVAYGELPAFFRRAFSATTLAQLRFLRSRLHWRRSRVDAMVGALVVGVLHGDLSSGRYLSNQMPRTVSTKPDYSVRYWRRHRLRPPERDVFDVLRREATFRYESEVPERRASVELADMRDAPRVLHHLAGRVKCVVTSPPYFDVTSYGEDQWLRQWVLGGEPWPSKRGPGDDRHTSAARYWSFMADFWRMASRMVADRGHVVLRIGTRATDPELLPRKVLGAALASPRRVRLVDAEFSEIRRRQTNAFRPGAKGLRTEVDCHFRLD